MRRKIAAAVVVGALMGGFGLVGTAGAGQPAIQACIGDMFNGDAPENGGPMPGAGDVVVPIAQGKMFGPFGQAMQALQAGMVPPEVFPNPCYVPTP